MYLFILLEMKQVNDFKCFIQRYFPMRYLLVQLNRTIFFLKICIFYYKFGH